jgi:hypothetical protein
MRDSATGRSRGFGFLTFRDPKTVNTVMVKEHYLDGKIVSSNLEDFCPRNTKNKKDSLFCSCSPFSLSKTKEKPHNIPCHDSPISNQN